jgi:hypothetical protein
MLVSARDTVLGTHRLRRVGRVHAQPPLQLGNLRFELLYPLSLSHHEGRQLRIGRTLAGRHPAMIDKTGRRSSSHAADLINYILLILQ